MPPSSLTRRRFLCRSFAVSSLLCPIPQPLWAFAGSSFQPADTQGVTFLFQGDSITDGNRGRSNDLNHIMGHGYAFSIASRLGAVFPEKKLQFINRGISGNKVTDLSQRWQPDTLDLKPDVLSILVGVNDAAAAIKQQQTVAQYEETYRALLDQTRHTFPTVVLVVGEPFVLPVGKVKDSWEVWLAAVTERQHVVRRLASAYNAILVPYQQTFNNATQRAPADYWIWDGIHPTVAGHELMAQEWLQQVSQRLPFLKHYNRRL